MTVQNQPATQSQPLVEFQRKSTGVWRILLFGILLMIGIGLIGAYGRTYFGEPIFLAVLGALACLGVFFLFSFVLGIISFADHNHTEKFGRAVIDDMDSGLVVSDHDGAIVYANRAYAYLIGATEVSDINSVEATFSRHAEASDIIYKMATGAKNGNSLVEEVRLLSGLRHENKGASWFRIRCRPLNLDSYKKSLLIWQVTDVTADRFRQENIFQNLQNAVHYLDHAPAGFIASEANGQISYLNATLADWLGLDLTRFDSGKMALEDLVLGDGLALLDAVRSGENEANTALIDLDLARSDGTRLPVRLYHRVQANVDGAPGSARTVVLNRIYGQESEDALREAEIRFTRFFDNTPVAIAALNSDGAIVRTNAPFLRMFGPAIEQYGSASGLKYTKITNQEERETLKQVFRAAMGGQGKIDPVDVSINGSNDRFIRVFASPVADAVDSGENGTDNDGERVIVYAMEITEQRAMEEQFVQGQKMQAVGQLAGGVAHDFNNVLTAIIGFSDLLLASHQPSDPSFQDIMNIKQNANRAASLVRQLLAFSRRQTLRPQVLNLGDVLSDLRMLLDRLLGEKVKLNVVHGRDLWPIKADISQFEQVIVNLAVNARDAMPDGGSLSIKTSNIDEQECAERFSYKELTPGEYVLIEVADEGTGMSAEIMEKVFEPFFSTKDVGQGTGLGLSTVYGIIKQTGGYIYPVSAEGEGTTFNVLLPRHVQTDEPEIEEDGPATDSNETKPRDLSGSATILLVEDEDAVRAFGSRALAARGYEVHEAASGVEALEVMEEYGGEIDLIVSDVVMPEMDGPTLLGEIRKTHPDLKFIFVSGYAEEAFAKNLPDQEREKFGFLPKPFSLKQLATTVKEMLQEGPQ